MPWYKYIEATASCSKLWEELPLSGKTPVGTTAPATGGITGETVPLKQRGEQRIFMGQRMFFKSGMLPISLRL